MATLTGKGWSHRRYYVEGYDDSGDRPTWVLLSDHDNLTDAQQYYNWTKRQTNYPELRIAFAVKHTVRRER